MKKHIDIYMSSQDPAIVFAAAELKKYLRMMMPENGEIHIGCDPLGKEGFRLGIMSDFGVACDVDDVELDDVIYIETTGCGGVIAGSNPRSVLLAVYRYLQENGCRWLFPGVDGEHIPVCDIHPVSYFHKADTRFRGQCNEGAENQQIMMDAIDFTPKIGMNTFMLEFNNPRVYYDKFYRHKFNQGLREEKLTDEVFVQWKRQCEDEIKKRGLVYHDMGHGWTAEPFGISSTRGWEKNTDEIPKEAIKYLALVNGKREYFGGVPLNTNICMSNSEARAIVARGVADYAETHGCVDFLHVWLADNHNNHCECENCREKRTSDWYVMMLNDIDEELTRRGLNTRIVFISYYDTMWKPVSESFINPGRFSLLFAPITRKYTESLPSETTVAIGPYALNKLVFPQGMDVTLAYLNDWKQIWKGSCFMYEYHFWQQQYFDMGGMFISRIISEDIKALALHGIHGIIEDGSQRSAFPTGFPMYVYGQTLFDTSASYEALKQDYYSHAFGEDYRTVIEYLEKLSAGFDFEFISGMKSADPEKGKHYNPAMTEKFLSIKPVILDFRQMAEEKMKQKMPRAACVSWDLLIWHADYCLLMADAFSLKAGGDDEKALEAFNKAVEFMSPLDYIRINCYDHYLNCHILNERIFKIRKKV